MPELKPLCDPWWVRAYRERSRRITRGLTILCAFGLIDVALVIGVSCSAVLR